MLLRYQTYILTSCEFVDDLQMGVSIDFGNYGYALSFPVLVCCPSATLFRHHGIDASAFLRMDWIVDEHSEDVFLSERPWRDLIIKPYEQYKQRSETPRERPKLLA